MSAYNSISGYHTALIYTTMLIMWSDVHNNVVITQLEVGIKSIIFATNEQNAWS